MCWDGLQMKVVGEKEKLSEGIVELCPMGRRGRGGIRGVVILGVIIGTMGRME